MSVLLNIEEMALSLYMADSRAGFRLQIVTDGKDKFCIILMSEIIKTLILNLLYK